MLLIVRDVSQLIRNLPYKRYCNLAFWMGALIALAMPPFDIWIAVIPAFNVLFLLIDQKSFKTSFTRGYWFGLGYFTLNLFWIAFALNVEIEKFFWLIPFALLGIPAILSFYIAITCGLLNMFRLSLPIKWLYFAATWGVMEWLRGHLFTGFPWSLMGYSWMACPSILQCTSVIGVYGLSVLTVLFATLPLLYINNYKKWFWGFLAIFVLIWGAGHDRLTHAPAEYVDNICLRLVQPCIPQKLKWDQASKAENFATHIRLSQLPSQQTITHIIWPEAAVPFFLEHDANHRQQIGTVAPTNGTVILGGLRYQSGSQFHPSAQIWNSLLVLNAEGDIVAYYDKTHLVPFGEYIPLRVLWPSMVKKVTHGTIDFTPGTGLNTLYIKGLPPFSPLVCYEGIFPHQVVKLGDDKAKWLLNLTNDAWYGDTSGPYQHFAITRVRAIEQGIPLVRVANNGISAIVDPYGRIDQQLSINQQGVIDCLLPKAIEEPTYYAEHGDKLFFIIIGLIGLICCIHWLRINKFNLTENNLKI